MQAVFREFSIPVRTIKGGDEDFKFTGSDTVQKLQKWITENQGIPADQQRMIVVCGNRFCPKKIEINANPKDLLTRHIPKDAAYISIWIRLRGVRSI